MRYTRIKHNIIIENNNTKKRDNEKGSRRNSNQISVRSLVYLVACSYAIHKSKNVNVCAFVPTSIIPTTPSSSSTSNLFRDQNRQQIKSRASTRQRFTSSALKMVLTTPAAVIEQASTKILLDDLIDESVRTQARSPIMMQFDPSSGWIWRRWKGTVFSETWRTFIRNMIYASVVCVIFKCYKTQFLQNLSGFNILWGQLLSVTTFTLTFFLNQSYQLWRTCYGFSRRLQGRLNDLNMTMAAHAARSEPTAEKKEKKNSDSKVTASSTSLFSSVVAKEDEDEEDEDKKDKHQFSVYTEPARQVLELMARYTRVFNLLTYASFTGSHRPLLTPQGMRRLVDRGIITEDERQVLSDVQVPVTQRHNVLLLWIIRLFLDARKAGHIEGSDGFEQQFLEKCHVIRAQYGGIGDELSGRMPLAYAHIVQVLVDIILWMYPFMAFSTGMTPVLGVLGTGLLSLFYQGLFDLAKQFLDPYDNESYGKGEDPLCIDTLIAETNSGSVRWMNGLAEKPFSYHKLAAGETLDYQLPLRGWTVEENDEREEKELMEQLRLEQEEAERGRLEEESKAMELATQIAQEAMAVQEANEEAEAPEIETEAASDVESEAPLILEIDDGLEEIMNGPDVLVEECPSTMSQSISQKNMTMEEALNQMDDCTEKVP
ncbi:hypothetical protein CTEN210_14536 [Chaetoceros tenuissimus]|uniref:Bestrophin homolog n=1 Tax=Chaetoceros tenuissimus TaxID=426638 RepID=A0AAD3D7P6_9STRA|nr:hypothetical protein CTEN210_14536 [Chaetoceros tenuissimus]